MSSKTTAAELPKHGTTVVVELGERRYPIVIEAGLLSRAAEHLGRWNGVHRQAAVVTDANVRPHAERVVQGLISAGWRCELVELPPGETTKSLRIVEQVYDRLVALRADRQTLVVAVGGGVIGDTAGFVAATYNRGLPFVQIPTTVMAAVDSSVGGKVGVNHPQGKNLIGAFHQPRGVLIDPETLATLPERDYCAGLAEVVKYGVILDAEFFEFLEHNIAEILHRTPSALSAIIARSCELKAQVVEHDEFERTGVRAVLNYGHTFAHAFEAVSGYGELLHGEAVSIGMICASRLAVRLGRITDDVTQRQLRLLQAFRLPTQMPTVTSDLVEQWFRAMFLDKKNTGGKLRFVLPDRLGHVELVDGVSPDHVRAVLNACGG